MVTKKLETNHHSGSSLASQGAHYWLVKQEPTAYSWDTFLKEGATSWTGVRNFQARNHLRSMHLGDQVLFYHSVSNPSVVGVATVIKTAYPDPTSPGENWSAVDLKALFTLKHPLSLAQIKADPHLLEIPLLKQSRLSVMPLKEKEFLRILELGQHAKN